jgi:drug/metabolite transporter (DMT)-like permease
MGVSRLEILAHIGFCATGVISAVIIDYTQLHGMQDDVVEIFPSFVGPSFAAIFLWNKSNARRFDWRFWIVLGCDLLGMLLIVLSISHCGSALFFITFSWITIFAATLKRMFLGKGQTCYQWFALVFMTVGLCASAAGADVDYGIDVFKGVFFGFCSAIVYSVYYITCDSIGHMKDAPSPESLCAFDGVVGSWLLGTYIVLVKGPYWDEIVVKPVEKVSS